MAAVGLLSWAQLRRRWPSLVGFTLLVAFVGAGVLIPLVGARRTATSVDRFRAWAKASDVSYQSSGLGQAAAMMTALRGLPQVEAASARRLINAIPIDGSVPDIGIVTDTTGVYGTGLDRPRIVDGRLPRPDAPDEILLGELTAQLTGLDVGDRLRAQSWSPADLHALFDEANFPGFNGPRLDLEVVGIGRMPQELSGDVRRGELFALGSPAFLPAHPGVGAWPPAVVVRLRGGAADIDAVSAALRSLPRAGDGNEPPPTPAPAAEVYLDTSRQTVGSLVAGLLLFASGVTAAGALAVGQAVTRQIATASETLRGLGALGLTRSQVAAAISVPIVVAGMVGVVGAVALAIAASPVLPTGLARRAEVQPGVWIQPDVLGAGGAAILVLLAAFSFGAARSRHRPPAASVAPARPAALTRLAKQAGAPPSILIGAQLATDRSRGPRAVPARPAVVGLALGIAGILAAGVIASSLDGLTGTPARWGWNWSTLPDYFGEGDVSELEDRLIEDDRVDAVGTHTAGTVSLEGTFLTAQAMTPLKGDLSLTRLDGRLPSGPGEIALGQQTMGDLGLHIGDTIDALDADGRSSRRLVVSGTAVFPPTEEYTSDVGAALTPDGLAALDQGEALTSLALRYPPGAHPEAIEAGLEADYGLSFTVFAKPQTPGFIGNLAEARDVATALALFFAALGAVGLLQALLVSTRRRRGQLAVLQALGFGPRQVRRAIHVQALILTTTGGVVGIPAGLITGRLVWRRLVGHLGVVADPQTPWRVIGVTLCLAAVGAAILSWWPGRRAVGSRPARALRAE